MPESKARKKAENKKVAARKRDAASKRPIKISSRAWVPFVFVPVGLLGVLWLLVYYIAGAQVPVMSDIGSWNFLIGIGAIAASFFIATLWK